MIRFKHYNNSGSLGNIYGFGVNFYKDSTYGRHSFDMIIGKNVYVWFWDNESNE